MKTPPTEERKVALAIGRAFLHAQLSESNPQMEPDKLKALVVDKWNSDRKAYVKTGSKVLRLLTRAGYTVASASPGSARPAPARKKV